MQAGKLRHRVAIQSQATTLNTYGEPDQTWSTDETVWASIDPVSGNETMSAESIQSIISHTVTMRYTSNASAKKRLLFGARVFGILSVIDNMERNRMLVLDCEEQKN